MRPVIIGAGRGSRLGPETSEIPKTMVPVMGRPMLDWILDALGEAGVREEDVVFICGYADHVVRARHPKFTFVENTDWPNNNILASLLYAREFLKEGFLSTYADIVYEGDMVEKLLASNADITLGCDTAWRRRYVSRTQHPESDAEKLVAKGPSVIELSRRIESERATGEFIGVMKLNASGAEGFLEGYDRARSVHQGRVWRDGRTFEKAYLIDLLQDLIERGTEMQRVDTRGGYMEIDTLEDLGLAEHWWTSRRP